MGEEALCGSLLIARDPTFLSRGSLSAPVNMERLKETLIDEYTEP
jgi:hypothetical protein